MLLLARTGYKLPRESFAHYAWETYFAICEDLKDKPVAIVADLETKWQMSLTGNGPVAHPEGGLALCDRDPFYLLPVVAHEIRFTLNDFPAEVLELYQETKKGTRGRPSKEDIERTEAESTHLRVSARQFLVAQALKDDLTTYKGRVVRTTDVLFKMGPKQFLTAKWYREYPEETFHGHVPVFRALAQDAIGNLPNPVGWTLNATETKALRELLGPDALVKLGAETFFCVPESSILPRLPEPKPLTMNEKALLEIVEATRGMSDEEAREWNARRIKAKAAEIARQREEARERQEEERERYLASLNGMPPHPMTLSGGRMP